MRIVRFIGGRREVYALMALAELADYPAVMFTSVIVGSSSSRLIGGRMVTPGLRACMSPRVLFLRDHRGNGALRAHSAAGYSVAPRWPLNTA
jgi:hypothetical protein